MGYEVHLTRALDWCESDDVFVRMVELGGRLDAWVVDDDGEVRGADEPTVGRMAGLAAALGSRVVVEGQR
ncbi:hypothetical protein ACQPZJ_38600 [Actinoplanes sp. CA-054009]